MTRYSLALTAAAAAALLASPVALADGPHNLGVEPFWIVSLAPLISTRLDPIISPGGVSGHGHSVVGGSAFGPSYHYEPTRASKCTTANIAVDRSNYWVPQLYRKQAGGGFQVAPLQYTNAYYQTRRTGKEPVYEFPPGFRMLAGNASRHTFDSSDPRQAAVSYVCLGNGGPETPGFPEKNCPMGLRAQVYFPHCWDGVNNWLEGSAHVSYGEGRFDGGGKCPPSHPKRIMGLFYEFIFKDDYPYQPGARVWANGDDAGFSFHGDFANGWPEGFFKQIYDEGENCAVGFALDSCKPIAPHFAKNGSACAPEGVIVDEAIGLGTSVAALPGNNPVWGLSGAKKANPNYVEKGLFKAIAPSVPSNWAKTGCIAEATSGRALKGAMQVFEKTMTPQACMAFCAGKGFRLAGIEFGKECYCDNTLQSGATEKLIDAGTCSMPCSGMELSQGYCGGPSALTLYKYTGTGNPTAGEAAAAKHFNPTPSSVPSVKAERVCANMNKGDPVFSTQFPSCAAGRNLGALPTPAGPLNFPTGQGQAAAPDTQAAAPTTTATGTAAGAGGIGTVAPSKSNVNLVQQQPANTAAAGTTPTKGSSCPAKRGAKRSRSRSDQ